MLISVLLVISAYMIGTRAASTTLETTWLDWYTQSVGETPCRTYERLRQLCDSNYLVRNFKPNPPGDSCTDKSSECCCNSVAFNLSMLCLNVQYGVGSGVGNDTGYDAPPGTYQSYLGDCGTPTNQSLPSGPQVLACKQGIRMPASVYKLFWNDGAWFSEFFRRSSGFAIEDGANTTDYCNNNPVYSSDVSSTPPQSTPPTSTPTQSTLTQSIPPQSTPPQSTFPQSSSPHVGTIVGGVFGALGFLAISTFVFWSIRRQSRRSTRIIDLIDDKEQDLILEPLNLPDPGADVLTPFVNDTSPHRAGVALPDNHTGRVLGKGARDGHGSAESGGTQLLIRNPTLSSARLNEWHEDSAELTQAFGLGRSASGRLPPTYQER